MRVDATVRPRGSVLHGAARGLVPPPPGVKARLVPGRLSARHLGGVRRHARKVARTVAVPGEPQTGALRAAIPLTLVVPPAPDRLRPRAAATPPTRRALAPATEEPDGGIRQPCLPGTVAAETAVASRRHAVATRPLVIDGTRAGAARAMASSLTRTAAGQAAAS